MMHIGLQELRVRWLGWYTLSFFFGVTLGSCQVDPDTVFRELDELDSNDGGSEAGGDSETMMLDSGSNILESGLNDQDGTIPSPEGGIDTLFQPPFECPDLDTDSVLEKDQCTRDITELSSDDSNYVSGWRDLFFLERVESEKECSSFLNDFLSQTVVNDLEMLPEDFSSDSPCPRLCGTFVNVQDINPLRATFEGFVTFLLMRRYYEDSNDPNIQIACPLTCETIRCGQYFLTQLFVGGYIKPAMPYQ